MSCNYLQSYASECSKVSTAPNLLQHKVSSQRSTTGSKIQIIKRLKCKRLQKPFHLRRRKRGLREKMADLRCTSSQRLGFPQLKDSWGSFPLHPVPTSLLSFSWLQIPGWLLTWHCIYLKHGAFFFVVTVKYDNHKTFGKHRLFSYFSAYTVYLYVF